jgi:hypothetical protein
MMITGVPANLRRAVLAWRACARSERALFVEAWCLLLWYWLRWRIGLRGRTPLRGGAGSRTVPLPADATRPEAERVIEVFRKALHHHVLRASCVPQSLALQRLLQRRGWSASIRVGIRRSGDSIEGHAWVESDRLAPGGRDGGAASFVACHGQQNGG